MGFQTTCGLATVRGPLPAEAGAAWVVPTVAPDSTTSAISETSVARRIRPSIGRLLLASRRPPCLCSSPGRGGPVSQRSLTDAEYRQLYDFRARLLRFLRASEGRIRDAGITPTQYLLLLAVRASDSKLGPAIGDVAEFLVLKHHSVVELVDRA